MTAVERLLLQCLSQERSVPDGFRVPANTDWPGLLELAKRHHVRPTLFQRLSQADSRRMVPPDILSALDHTCQEIAKRNLALHAELRRLLAAWHHAGIPAIVLKGMHVATEVYGNPALREIGDMDVLVRRNDIERAASVAIESGYAPAKSFDVETDVAVHYHLSQLFKPPTFVLEIHWNITGPGQSCIVEPAQLWEQPVSVPALGPHAAALSPEHLMLHLCLHITYGHRCEFGLRSLCDLARLMNKTTALNWALVGDRAERWRCIRGVSLSVRLAAELLGVSLPAEGVGAFDAAAPKPEVISAAAQQLLVGFRGGALPRGVSELDDHPEFRAKLKHFHQMIFLPAPKMRQLYPRLSRGLPGRWFAYALRLIDLVRRRSGLMFRRWAGTDPALNANAERQRRIRAFLLEP